MRLRDFAISESADGCERCAQLEQMLQAAENNLAELGGQLAGLQHQLRRAAGAEQALRQQLEQREESDPKSQDVRAVLAGWEARHPRAKTPMTGKRAKTVRAALRMGYTVDQLKLALEGLAKFPFVGPSGRCAAGTPAQRYDDVDHALRDETTIERFIGYATNPQAQANVQSKAPSVPSNVRRERPAGDPVDRLLERLEAVKPSGLGKWTARCPAHEDRNASLSVSAGRQGVLAHCFAGCSVDAIADAVGMPITEWFDAVEEPANRVKRTTAAMAPDPLPTAADLDRWHTALMSNAKLLARLVVVKGWRQPALEHLRIGWDGRRLTIPVRDKDGVLVNVNRYLPNGQPKMMATRGRERDLFPAPETVGGSVIWIVEGEPDAIAAHSIGLPAVGLPGATNWRDEWAPRFADRRVVVCCDCDQPGRTAATTVHDSLAAAGVDVRVHDLDPARDDKFDLTDWVLAGGTLADLQNTTELRRAA